MKHIKAIPETIIRLAFQLSVWLIERFYNMGLFARQVDELRRLQKGTLGREVAECLDKHKLNLVPGYESHDLKHTLLNYKMTPVDEIRLQAFMIGNGNISVPSIVIFTFGFILLPYKWIQFAKDFRKGLHSKQIKEWTLEEYADRDLNQLRESVVLADRKEFKTETLMKNLAFAGSVSAMVAGLFGMLFCLPFLFSPILEDLVGAGFPFVGGAILFSAGLISMNLRNKGSKENSYMAALATSKDRELVPTSLF